VGHDWGGAIAWHFAATHPQACRRLVVLNCPHPRMLARSFRKSPRQLKKSWYMFAFQFPKLPELALTRGQGAAMYKMYRQSTVDPAHFGAREIGPIVEAMQAPGAARAAVDYYRTALRKLASSGGSEARLAPISVPSLLIWGKKDAFLDYASVVPGTEKYAPGLEIQVIEEGGHFVQQERPDEVNSHLTGFLRA
jgi:pimeloyl-ACP methyl ester carboxylesterase